MYRENVNADTAIHSPNHALIVCTPLRWDVFYENPSQYRMGKRAIYTQNFENQWQKKEVSSLHEKDIILYDRKP